MAKQAHGSGLSEPTLSPPWAHPQLSDCTVLHLHFAAPPQVDEQYARDVAAVHGAEAGREIESEYKSFMRELGGDAPRYAWQASMGSCTEGHAAGSKGAVRGAESVVRKGEAKNTVWRNRARMGTVQSWADVPS